MHAHLTDKPIDLPALLSAIEDPAAGALAIFVGTVRNENEGRTVEAITYEAHEALAESTLATIKAEVLASYDIRHCLIVHRIGHLRLGEASVAIVVRSAHRDAAFGALRSAIEELKKRVPIWKREHYVGGDAKYLEGVPLTEAPTHKGSPSS